MCIYLANNKSIYNLYSTIKLIPWSCYFNHAICNTLQLQLLSKYEIIHSNILVCTYRHAIQIVNMNYQYTPTKGQVVSFYAVKQMTVYCSAGKLWMWAIHSYFPLGQYIVKYVIVGIMKIHTWSHSIYESNWWMQWKQLRCQYVP